MSLSWSAQMAGTAHLLEWQAGVQAKIKANGWTGNHAPVRSAVATSATTQSEKTFMALVLGRSDGQAK